MPWTSLITRYETLPLILAGPIWRKVEPEAVTVWLALKAASTVTLRVYARDEDGNLHELLLGTHSTVRIGDSLHVVAVTARITQDREPLSWGKLYYYDL